MRPMIVQLLRAIFGENFGGAEGYGSLVILILVGMKKSLINVGNSG